MMTMEETEKVKFIRAGLIEQERLKLKTAQGKRVIPVFLDILDNLNDIEYVFLSGTAFFFRFSKIFYLFSATLAHAIENPIPGIEDDDLAEIKLDEPTIEKLKQVTTDAIMKVKVETKAQRLADAHGAIGWKTVKGTFFKNEVLIWI